MSRTISAATQTAASGTYTQPGILTQIGFSSILRYSSRGDVTWNGALYQANNVRASQLSEQPNGSTQITLIIGNTDGAFGAICLAETPQEKPITVWQFYEGATAAGDPVAIFSGVIESVDITEQAVTLVCSDLNASTLVIPRERITRASGFNRLIPASKVIEWNGLRLELSRAVE